MKNPKLQYMKGSNNFYVYVPRKVVQEQRIEQGEEVNIKKWAKTIQREKGSEKDEQ